MVLQYLTSSVVDPDLLNVDTDTDPDRAFQVNLDSDPDLDPGVLISKNKNKNKKQLHKKCIFSKKFNLLNTYP